MFALLGVKVDALQNVGQNRHLKLRLEKGGRRFDAIFFSTTASDCGVAVGMRVDAAFHLQINEFRGSSSVQLQLIDLRPALGPSVRERECLELVGRLVSGGALTEREAIRLLPRREQFVSLWRAIERLDREELWEGGRLPMLRSLAAALDGTESFLRAAVGLEIFAERGLVAVTVREERMTLRPLPGRRADLEESVHMEALRRALGKKDGKRGL